MQTSWNKATIVQELFRCVSCHDSQELWRDIGVMLKLSYLWSSKIWAKGELPTVLPLWKASDIQLILWCEVDCFWLHPLKVTGLYSLSHSLYLTHACTHTNIFSYCLHIFCGIEQSQTSAQYISEDMTPFLRRIILKCCYHSTLVASLGIWCSLITFFLGSCQVSRYTFCIFQIYKSSALDQALLRVSFPVVTSFMWATSLFRSHPLTLSCHHDWMLNKCHLESTAWTL